jgi:uncharacterized protein (DUF2252 family)
MAEGRRLRQQVPRSSHGVWHSPDDRVDPIALLQAEEQNRLPELVPVRYGRMVASPFTFYRATAGLMASDLVTTPVSGLTVQASGDAHLSNFGAYATPERALVFDLNDFDETLPGPWEWDIKRLAASRVRAGRANGFRADDCTGAARAAVRSYREWMAGFATMSHLAVWYTRITAAEISADLPKAARKNWDRATKKATGRDHLQSLEKMTTMVDGKLRITDDPPLIVHQSDELVGDRLPIFAKTYRATLRDDVSALLQRYTFVDFAQKVVGVGSVGTRCYVVLMRGKDNDDPLFLQIKEASASVLEPYLGKSRYGNHGQRVVRGQHATQAASDIFLGWGRGKGVDFYVRQLRDMKGSAELANQSPDQMRLYAQLCGRVLARAHARTGDAAMISGYLGRGDTFDQAILAFAIAYADQTERDHAALAAAVKRGKVAAEMGR